MRRVLAILLICLGAIPAFAQFDMSSMSLMQASPALAMSRADIRKELKLTRDQDQAVSKIEKDLNAVTKGGDSHDPSAAMAAAMAGMDKLNQANKDIEAVLDEKQNKRLLEIRIQMMGPPGLQSSVVADALGLTDDQKDKLKSIQRAYQDELTNTMRNIRGSGGQKALVKKRAEADAKLLDLLTDAQKAKYKEMQGAPFKDARQKNPIF